MLLHAIAAALIAISLSGADSSARAVVAHALRAVEGDSAGVVEARWAQAVATDRNDSLSALGLATIARLTYRYADAERALAALMPVDRGTSSSRDAGGSSQGGVGVYAALGSLGPMTPRDSRRARTVRLSVRDCSLARLGIRPPRPRR